MYGDRSHAFLDETEPFQGIVLLSKIFLVYKARFIGEDLIKSQFLINITEKLGFLLLLNVVILQYGVFI